MSEDVGQANLMEADNQSKSDLDLEEGQDEDSDSDSDWSPEDNDEEEIVQKTKKSKIIKLNWKEFISMGMRCKLSNRQISNMNNALMVDMEEEDERKYLTPSKVRRLRIKYGLNLAKKHQETMSNLEVVAFDGKSSKVALEHCQTEIEDKTTVTCGVTHQYLDHFIVFPGTGFLIGYKLFKVHYSFPQKFKHFYVIYREKIQTPISQFFARKFKTLIFLKFSFLEKFKHFYVIYPAKIQMPISQFWHENSKHSYF